MERRSLTRWGQQRLMRATTIMFSRRYGSSTRNISTAYSAEGRSHLTSALASNTVPRQEDTRHLRFLTLSRRTPASFLSPSNLSSSPLHLFLHSCTSSRSESLSIIISRFGSLHWPKLSALSRSTSLLPRPETASSGTPVAVAIPPRLPPRLVRAWLKPRKGIAARGNGAVDGHPPVLLVEASSSASDTSPNTLPDPRPSIPSPTRLLGRGQGRLTFTFPFPFPFPPLARGRLPQPVNFGLKENGGLPTSLEVEERDGEPRPPLLPNDPQSRDEADPEPMESPSFL